MLYKNFLITGATSGIGAATAKRLSQQGAQKIIITGRRQDRLEQMQQALSSPTCTVKSYCFDIRDRQAVDDFVNQAKADLENIDVLVNNAGLAAGRELFQESLIDDWEQMIDTNIKGLLYITRAILPMLLAKKSGHIVNLGSIAGHAVYPMGSVYCATKFAVNALTEALRMDTLGSGIRVTAIDPGMVETEFSLVRFKGDQAKSDAVYQGVTPLTPDDVADAICWSLSRPKHVNVQQIVLMPTDQASVRDIARR
jgi:3-hydroxy acid dehydrogenase/malonic semialdehyde reductase